MTPEKAQDIFPDLPGSLGPPLDFKKEFAQNEEAKEDILAAKDRTDHATRHG